MNIIFGIKRWVIFTTISLVGLSITGWMLGSYFAKKSYEVDPCGDRIGLVTTSDPVYRCPENTHAGWAPYTTGAVNSIVIHCACNTPDASVSK